jgi:hypothetical protein
MSKVNKNSKRLVQLKDDEDHDCLLKEREEASKFFCKLNVGAK